MNAKPLRESLVELIFIVSAVFSSLITLSILVFMLLMGLPLIAEGGFFELFSTGWHPGHGQLGILPMIAGTLVIAPLGLAIALPACLGVSALITVFASGATGTLIKRFVQFMTGIPTVVYGFIGIFLLVPLVREIFAHGSGMSVLAASLLIAVLVAPTMILFFADAFNNVPRTYLLACDAVGGNQAQKFFYVIFPNAWRGVLSGVILALGRALGDTMIALMIAGNAAQLPGSLLDSARTLTSHIALIQAADYHSLEFKSIFACGLALYVIATILVVTYRQLLQKEGSRR